MALNESVAQFMINKDARKRCSQWVDDVKVASPLSENNNELKRRLPESESDDHVETDSEFDSVSESGAGSKRRHAVALKAEKLHLVCEWKDCDFTIESLDAFLKHVANHVPELDIRITAEIEVYGCLWSGCNYESSVDTDIMRHVNYHSFHTKLKCIGKNVRGRIKLPKCRRDAIWKNILETLPPHECQWNKCNQTFNNYQLFLYHMLGHIENNPRGNKVDGGIMCQWTGCNSKYPSIYKLREHVRVHTKEKILACPDCGWAFASNTKFHYHCKRQIPLEVQGYQCSHCNKFYPTECILREHLRSHVFHYRCDKCGMSCDSPSSLSRHILYRHSTTRGFPCNQCSHAAKSQKDLDSHMMIHLPGQTFACEFDGCNYSCKNAYTLERHIEKVHRLEIRWYCCHECPVKYRKSYRLTRHLIEAHHLQWLNGHKRFQYILQEDGCYRLQAVRYESVDDDPPISRKDMKNESIEEPEQKQVEPVVPCILISIDEIDEKGNIISSKIIETQETKFLTFTPLNN
ncbi:histone H4 transcription factor isoform X2 [Copidosoma floridanum]|uniref:histone H4 transcription factor isoform X2 n=1 Tax=Copidosoma floridanum TaxID=29053 RepID=UPI0006C9A300|nr:histone H4 transcription factor isoform X2 [Copidosoma floridanum]